MRHNTIDYPRVLFTESQRISRRWFWVMVAVVPLVPLGTIALVFWLTGVSFRRLPGPVWALLVFSTLLPFLVTFLRMNVTVRTDEIIIRYLIIPRRIAHMQIATFELIKYHWTDFGGYGMRWNGDNIWSYTMSGDRAVRLVLHDKNKRVIIGTQRPEELTAALEQAGIRRIGEPEIVPMATPSDMHGEPAAKPPA